MIELLSQLLRSRKFLIAVLDTLASMIFYFGSTYVGELCVADTKSLIGVQHAPVLKLIYAIPRENDAQISWMLLLRPRGLPRPRAPRWQAVYARPFGVSRSNRDVPCDDALRPRGVGQ